MKNNWPSRDAHKDWAKRLMAQGYDNEQIRAETRMEKHLIELYREEYKEKEKLQRT